MKKKILLSILGVLLLVGGAGYVFKEQLWQLVIMFVTKDTFIAADTDNFDPGLAMGENFPDIRALYNGQEIDSVNDFAYNKGMVFIANRSADW
jgi:hypothetical protein